MSTVALKGTLAYDEATEEWSWKGQWAFGSCLADAVAKGTTATPSSSRVSSQPFRYRWKEASDPANVPVPSLNVLIIGGEEEDDNAGKQTSPHF